MKLKKKLLITLGVIVAAAFVSGVSILAATSLGTQQDPLVTLSYLTNQFKPQIMTDVNASISQAEASLSPALDAKISSFKAEIDAKLSTSTRTESATFTLITLKKNQTLSCSVGTELLLRIGSATAVGSSPAMVDTTTAGSLTSGAAVAANHLYMVTIEGNGLKAGSDTVKLLIRGAYTIS